MYLSSQYSASVNESQENVGLLTSQQRGALFTLNEVPTYGLYNRNDFMQRCYKRVRKINDKTAVQLKRLLCFGGESSKKGDCFSSFFFVLVFLIPIMTLAVLVPNNLLSSHSEVAVISCCLFVLILLVAWHSYSIYAIGYNMQRWKESWFTLEVDPCLIPLPGMPIGSNTAGDRFFDIRKNIRYYDITKESIVNSPLLGIGDKEMLTRKFEELNIARARLILHTRRFIHAVSIVPRDFAIVLLALTVVCVILSFMELMSTLSVI